MRRELYRSENLSVRREGDRGGTMFVTFGSYTSEPSLDREGFGESFLRRLDHDAIHVINSRNRWYQHPEREEALAAIAAVTRDYDRVITYGSSMGGYAALRYAVACGADVAVALSPQFSVDPRVVPWEIRWQPDVARIRFAEPGYVPAAVQYVFYDPRVPLDRLHAEQIAQVAPARLIPIPYGGHPVGPLLAETGALQSAIRSIIADDFDPADVRRRVRKKRSESQHQYFVFARHCAARHPTRALRLLERAAAIEPESHIASAQAVLLDRLGRVDEAGSLHRAAVERTPSNGRAWVEYSLHLEASGNTAAARRALQAAASRQTGAMLMQVRTAQLRMWLRRVGLRPVDRMVGKMIARIRGSRHHGAILRILGIGLR